MFSANFCSRQITERTKLKRHELLHTGETNFSCTYCDKSYSRLDRLNFHERIHTGENTLSCKDCEKIFQSTAGLKYHRSICKGGIKRNKKVEKNENNKSDNQMQTLIHYQVSVHSSALLITVPFESPLTSKFSD